MAKLLIIEAFYGGSHKQLLDTILQNVPSTDYDLFTLPAKKWHWKARLSAVYFSQTIPQNHSYSVLLTSSMMNLSELIGIRPDLARCHKIVYFHENQLVYPVQAVKVRDCQYGLNQITTCLSADCILFNSQFNKMSFLDNIDAFLNIQRDIKMKHMRELIESKCQVAYFPIDFERMPRRREQIGNEVLHVVWPHRWEHDKNPQLFAETLIELCNRNVPFNVSIIGEQFEERPGCFDATFEQTLGKRLVNFGYLSREAYFECLLQADIVVSTANHEFYGVSMLEAVHCGCLPLAPNKLVYPEIYPIENLYNTPKQLVKVLTNWCSKVGIFRKKRQSFFANFNVHPFSVQSLLPFYLEQIFPETRHE